MSGILPSITQFFERFPDARTAYASRPLYHQTHSRYLPGIQAEGLRPNQQPFPREQGEFLLRIYQRYATPPRREHIDYIQNRALDPSRLYLSAVHPSEAFMEYAVPERLMLLMRGMAALITKESLTSEERAYAQQTLEDHKQALTRGNPQTVTLEIDPLAPSAVNARLSQFNLATIPDADVALDVIMYADGAHRNNIALHEGIGPEFICGVTETPFALGSILRSIEAAPDWTRVLR